jgi:aspartate aminotransferase
MQTRISDRVTRIAATMSSFIQFESRSTWSKRVGQPGICDFVFGNPHEMPLPGFVSALQQWSTPQNQEWFAYKLSEPEPRGVVALALRERLEMPFDPEDIALTNGAFAALAVALTVVTNPGDEVIMITPPWFFYEALITAVGARTIRVPVESKHFDLNVDAIDAAITENTRAIIVNSPNNPTGRIYPPETLRALARRLEAASDRYGRPIYLLSDEAYSRIIFDGRPYHSPTAFYPYSFLLYTYGKTLLTPGQRLGYVAVPPSMPGREQFREALLVAQIATGFAWPNALLQHALPDLESLSIDIEHLQRKRDRMVTALREMGYNLHVPEGTFYLLVDSPVANDLDFVELLASHDVFVLPGTIVELPGTFRISLTANDDMIDRALPHFAAAIEQTGYATARAEERRKNERT